ncbi:hypothetical protein Goarm_013705 [Gossypium armourianum]|uniref:Uncharacterized protein n=1 Tax=Gossypium armourianum TaxID=34283 RepID=A0A7J9J3T8_9ROSI|nr:hypothetical protein [Gossypium armourianum]
MYRKLGYKPQDQEKPVTVSPAGAPFLQTAIFHGIIQCGRFPLYFNASHCCL